MRRPSTIAVSLLLALALLAKASVPNQVTVYVTETGSKYHTAGCQYLRKSKIPILLNEAKRHYTPCSKCGPPR